MFAQTPTSVHIQDASKEQVAIRIQQNVYTTSFDIELKMDASDLRG